MILSNKEVIDELSSRNEDTSLPYKGRVTERLYALYEGAYIGGSYIEALCERPYMRGGLIEGAYMRGY